MSLIGILRVTTAFARGTPDMACKVLRDTAGTTTRSFHASSALSAVRDSLAETSKTGEFQRRDAAWRDWISQGRSLIGWESNLAS